MAAPDRLRIAVVGQGFMGKAHSLGWLRAGELPGVALRAVLSVLCGRDEAALARNASLYGYGRTSTDWREVVGATDVDLVDVCTPGSSHAEICLAALEGGKHVLCEKPLANTLDEAAVLAAAAAAAQARGVATMVGFNYRRVPAIGLARSLVAEGRLGRLRHVRAAYLQDWLVDPAFPLAWRLDAAEAGSGALGDLGAHVVDLVRHLSGEELTEVAAALETFVRRRPLPPAGGSGTGLSGPAGGAVASTLGEVTVDDACLVLGRLSGGALVSIEATRMATGRKNALVLELNGSEGSLRFDLERLNELEVSERSAPLEGFTRRLVTQPSDPWVGQWWPPGHVLGWEHTFVHEFEDLLAAIAAGSQAEPSFADGLRTQAVLDAVSRSSATRSWVAVEPPPPG